MGVVIGSTSEECMSRGVVPLDWGDMVSGKDMVPGPVGVVADKVWSDAGVISVDWCIEESSEGIIEQEEV